MKATARLLAAGAGFGVAAGAVAVIRHRRRHLPAVPVRETRAEQPVLIINPHSGSGKADRYQIAVEAAGRGIEFVEGRGHKKIARLAKAAVKRGCDHLLIGGGDGSIAAVAKVARKHNLPLSVIPIGTRNHFAMDLGLDRADPVAALDAAFDGAEVVVDVGVIGGRLFLNNVSFGLYADAVADDGYRDHRVQSILHKTVETVAHPDEGLSVELPDGTVAGSIEMLLASNNPYVFIGPPDFAARESLDTGQLGVLLDNRPPDQSGPGSLRRWAASTITVSSDMPTIKVAVDGSDRKFDTPVAVGIDTKALRVVLPATAVARQMHEDPEHVTIAAMIDVAARREAASTSKLHRLNALDDAVFDAVAGWQSPLLDRVLPRLSLAASYSRLWFAIAAAVGLLGGTKGRTAAVNGAIAIANTSLLANLVLKRIAPRRRPTDAVPESRRLPQPKSSSFPSGHTASAAAFSGVVGAAVPSLWLPLNVLAATVGFSRVYTGVHYPGDVVAGWLLGKSVALVVNRSGTWLASRLKRMM